MTAFTDTISQALSKTGTKDFQGDTAGLYKSPLGTPVYSDFNVIAGSYSVNGHTVSYNAINLPDALFVVKKRKRIKSTGISGATSDLLEYNGAESAHISCTVRIYGSDIKYPLADVNNFYQMLQSNEPIQTSSWYLNQVEIYYVVITDYEISQQTGNISDQQVKFNMRQVNPTQYPTLLNG
jgi:hypothetical protein